MADHGTRTRYVTGCRCEPCRAAHRDYNRQWDRHQRRITYGLIEKYGVWGGQAESNRRTIDSAWNRAQRAAS